MQDFTTLKTEMLAAMRLRRTQNMVSRKMGFKYNQMHRWETNKTQIKWTDFLRVCSTLNIAIGKVLTDVFCYIGSPSDLGGFIHSITGPTPVKTIARDLKCSHQMVARWMTNKVSPPLEVVFQVVDTYSSLLPAFCLALANGKITKSLEKKIENAAKHCGIESNLPYCGAIRSCLELDEYQKAKKHQPGKIAKLLGISLEQEKLALETMENFDMITKENGKYRVLIRDIEFGSNIIASSKIARYWTERSCTRFQADAPPRTTPRGKNNFAHMTAAISNETATKIVKKWGKFYRELTNMIENDSGCKDRVQVILFHSFDAESVAESLESKDHKNQPQAR